MSGNTGGSVVLSNIITYNYNKFDFFKMQGKHVLVTVGTTKFERLIETVSSNEVLSLLHRLGYTTVFFQTGTGKTTEKSFPGVNLIYNPYVDDFCEAIKCADLVISHAGAGSCLEVLQNQKPLIVVINEDLMDNHQVELAQELQQRNYLYYCTCETLHTTLKNELNRLTVYPKANPKVFADYLDHCMGFK